MIKLVVLAMIAGFVFKAAPAYAATLVTEDFSDASGFTIGGGYAQYWGIAPLAGTDSIPSYFSQGDSQSGDIFYGSFAKGPGNDPAPTMTINLPDLTGYTNLKLSVALAAPDCTVSTCWEITHRDSLVISTNSGVLDSFLPISGISALRSQRYGTDLHYQFKDYEYLLDSAVNAITFKFASTGTDEVVGIDTLVVTGDLMAPQTKDECKNNGWERYGFKNQGACVSALMKLKKN